MKQPLAIGINNQLLPGVHSDYKSRLNRTYYISSKLLNLILIIGYKTASFFTVLLHPADEIRIDMILYDLYFGYKFIHASRE